MPTFFVTGATGFLGSHVAEQLLKRGPVLTLARPSSEVSLLEQWGVKILRGDLTDAVAVQQAVNEADVIIHCAAKVGDWGPVEDYRDINVGGTQKILDAVRLRQKPIEKIIHMSSLGVYEARHHHDTDESVPLPKSHMDGYTQTKLESERMVVEYQKSYNLPIVILRPGFIYGPRDRSWLPKVIDALEKRMVRYISGGHTALNSTYVLNLTHAMMLALDNSNAVGQIYNITDGEFVSKRRVFETVADFFGLKRPSRSIPLWLARIAARIMERRARRRGAKEAPRLTQARLKFLGLNLGFSIAKARKELGYTPPTSFQDAFQATLEWFRKERAAKSGN